MLPPDAFLLRDPDVAPTPAILQAALGRRYRILHELTHVLAPSCALTPEWRYYRDGGGWLCKLLRRRKNVAWLSVWSTGAKLTFYFSPGLAPAVLDLPLTAATRSAFQMAKPIGLLHPLTLTLARKSDLREAETLLRYRSGLR